MTHPLRDAEWLGRAYNALNGKPPTENELFDALRATRADDSTKGTEVRYRAPAAAVEELGQALLREAGLTDPTEAELVEVYRRAAKLLEVQS